MTHTEFLAQVSERTGLRSPEEADRAIQAVLEAVGARLSRQELRVLAEDLPSRLMDMLRSGTPGEDFGLEALHARVAEREHVREGFAVEHTGTVCQVLAEALSPAAPHRLQETLPGPLAALFTPRGAPERFEYPHLEPGGHTLAEGRPGSRHPVSEARPERAHVHSVARSANPHGDTKLSSAEGLTQEREHTTLADAHPGARLARSGED